MAESINNTIAELRAKAGITQEALAKEVGVTRQTIIAIEKGNYIPSLLLAMKIAVFFNKQVEALFSIAHER